MPIVKPHPYSLNCVAVVCKRLTVAGQVLQPNDCYCWNLPFVSGEIVVKQEFGGETIFFDQNIKAYEVSNGQSSDGSKAAPQ